MGRAALSPESLLRVDEKRTIKGINSYLRTALKENDFPCVMLGFSGGLDSSLLLTLAVNALGGDRVRAVYLYDSQSAVELRTNVRVLSRRMGVEPEELSIEETMREAGVYSSYAMRIGAISGPLNRLLLKACRVVFGENPFVTSLRVGKALATGKDRDKIRTYEKVVRHFEKGFNVRHLYRRRVLEEKAAAENCLVLGAANRTEWLTGWFVKGGIDDLPNQPLSGLYKTQVKQLAGFLDIPRRILSVAPSPDMMKGITDECALGIRYGHIDLALDMLEGGLTREDTARAGVSRREIDGVRKIKALSSWKRSPGKIQPPVQGVVSGGLRLGSSPLKEGKALIDADSTTEM